MVVFSTLILSSIGSKQYINTTHASTVLSNSDLRDEFLLYQRYIDHNGF